MAEGERAPTASKSAPMQVVCAITATFRAVISGMGPPGFTTVNGPSQYETTPLISAWLASPTMTTW